MAIPGASSVEQLEANVAAAEIRLTDGEHRALTETARRFKPVGGLGVMRLRRRVAR